MQYFKKINLLLLLWNWAGIPLFLVPAFPGPGIPTSRASLFLFLQIFYILFPAGVRVFTWSYQLEVGDLGEGFLPIPYTGFQPIPPFLAPASSLLSGISLASNFWAFSGTEQVDQLLITGTVAGPPSSLLSPHRPVNSSPFHPHLLWAGPKCSLVSERWNLCYCSLLSLLFRG